MYNFNFCFTFLLLLLLLILSLLRKKLKFGSAKLYRILNVVTLEVTSSATTTTGLAIGWWMLDSSEKLVNTVWDSNRILTFHYILFVLQV